VTRSRLADRAQGGNRPVLGPVFRRGAWLVSQPTEHGAGPIVFAATAPAALAADPVHGRRPERDVVGRRYFGPRGLGGMRGAPTPAEPSGLALDRELALRLWEASVAATGVQFAELG
jgi:hypothetical protein